MLTLRPLHHFLKVRISVLRNQKVRNRNLCVYLLTIFIGSHSFNRTLHSIADRREGQHLQFIFRVYKKSTDSFI